MTKATTNGRKKWTKENSKNVLHCYFKSNPTQSFNTSQRLADQTKMILKKGWFSDHEI